MNVLRSALKKTKKNDFHHKRIKPDVLSLDYSIQQHLEKEAAELNDISQKLSTHVTDIFRALGNYDVRFDFDPFSIDDCRCNIVSAREVNVLCSLKHVPLESLVIEEGDFPGQVKLRLKEDSFETFNEVSWDDFFESTCDIRYVNPTKIYECFSKAIPHAVEEVRFNMINASVGILESDTTIRLWFQLSEHDLYKVNLFPSIRVHNSCENFQCFLPKNLSNLPKALAEECCLERGIHVVAKPSAKGNSEANENQFWSVTFNDVERRIILSDTFECAKDCLTLLKIFNFFALEDGESLSNYQFQTIVLREIFTKPKSKKWKKDSLMPRMFGLMKSLKVCLQTGRCENMFTGVNMFSRINKTTLEKMAKNVCEYVALYSS